MFIVHIFLPLSYLNFFLFSLNTISGITNGLRHYWPINSDLFDYVGSSELQPGLIGTVNTGFGLDRFNKSNSSISMNPGYFNVPPGVYFTGGSFTISGWVQPISFNRNSYFFSCGNGPRSDNIYLAISNGVNGIPYAGIWKGSTSLNIIGSEVGLVMGEWAYLASVYNISHLLIYLNGQLVGWGDITGELNQNIWKTMCFLGRSNWYPTEHDVSAYFDEIRIYERDLSEEEIITNMNVKY